MPDASDLDLEQIIIALDSTGQGRVCFEDFKQNFSIFGGEEVGSISSMLQIFKLLLKVPDSESISDTKPIQDLEQETQSSMGNWFCEPIFDESEELELGLQSCLPML